MPNHCRSVLLIAAPTSEMDRILGAMRGPQDWFFPEGILHTPAQTVSLLDGASKEWNACLVDGHMTAHGLLALEARIRPMTSRMDHAGWRAERDRRIGHPQPAWLPLTMGCIARMAHDPAWPPAIPTVAFSLPRLLAPYDEVRAAFERVVADLPSHDLSWALEQRRGDVQIPVRMELLDNKWGAYNESFDPAQHVFPLPEAGWSCAAIAYTTAWSPMGNLGAALTTALAGTSARAAVVWHEEGGEQGCQVFTPDAGLYVDDGIDLFPPDYDEEDEDNNAAWDAFHANRPKLVFEEALHLVGDEVLQGAINAYIARFMEPPADADGTTPETDGATDT